MTSSELTGPVHVIGAGLLGTSIGLAVRAAGLPVWLSDANPEHLRTAVSLGAGEPRPDEGAAQLVVVAVPPLSIAEVVLDALSTGAVVTDIGSVKALPLEQVSDQASESTLARYVGSHPMAGSERSGPLAASAALFDGRPWAVTPHVHADPQAVALVEALVCLCGATPVRLSMSADGLELVAITQDVGQAHEQVDARFEGTDLTVAFNPEYLLDGIDVTPGDEITLSTVDHQKPAVIRSVDSQEFLYLLMPVRV